MQSIVYQDKTGGKMFIFSPKYPAQRSFSELKRTERIENAMKELEYTENINIFLYKHNKLRLISSHSY